MTNSDSKATAWALAIGVTAAGFALRLPGLLSQPIFCDESIYLRYAQIIRRAPLRNAFVSLIDPKPPLHYWLLALADGMTSDPLLGARLLSVVAGVASLLVLIPLCRELRRLPAIGREPRGGKEQPKANGDRFAAMAALLFLTCPFLAFYQRMALAESLLLLATLVVAWLGLALARDPTRGAWTLGLAMGGALLIKQNWSYVLMALPAVAGAITWKRLGQTQRRSWLRGFGLAVVVAIALFSPVLWIRPGASLRDRIFFVADHGDFAGGLFWHLRVAWDNLRYVFVPMTFGRTNPQVLYEGFQAPADAGWLWIYLTPPIVVLAVAGFVALAVKKDMPRLTFLSVWTVLMLLPFVPFATTAVSRYCLPAVPPLLLAAAIALERLWSSLRDRRATALATAVLLGILAWPARSIALQDFAYARQPLARSDRWQYVCGWPAGEASREAVDWIEARAARESIVVVTSHLVGTPDDVVWTSLEGTHNVSLFFIDWSFRDPILRPGPRPDTFWLEWGFHQTFYTKGVVSIPPGLPVFFIGMDPWPSPSGGLSTSPFFERNPSMKPVARFENPPMTSLPHRDAVVVYRLR